MPGMRAGLAHIRNAGKGFTRPEPQPRTVQTISSISEPDSVCCPLGGRWLTSEGENHIMSYELKMWM
jgi:hypothetical protein